MKAFVVSILFLVSVAFAQDWGGEPLMKLPKGGYDLTVRTVTGRLPVLTICPDMIVHTCTQAQTGDTIIVPSGCVDANSIWIASGFEVADSAFTAAADPVRVVWKTDTLITQRGTAANGADKLFLIRVK